MTPEQGCAVAEPAVETRAAIPNNQVWGSTEANRLGVVLALAAVYVVWGSTYLAMRIALEGFPPFLMAGIRFTISGLLLYGVLRARGIPNPGLRQWGGAAIVGALLLGVGNGGVVFAEQWVASGLAALGVATVPLWAALFAGLWGVWPSRREWIGLVIGFLGIVCLNLEGGLRASPLGAIALLLAAASWAFGSIWSRRLPLPSGLMASAAEMFCGGLVLLAMGGMHREHLSPVHAARPLFAMAYLILGAIVGFSAYVYLLRRVRPALATSYAYVNPVIAVALGACLAGEKITTMGLLALGLIVFGVALTAFAKRPGAGARAD